MCLEWHYVRVHKDNTNKTRISCIKKNKISLFNILYSSEGSSVLNCLGAEGSPGQKYHCKCLIHRQRWAAGYIYWRPGNENYNEKCLGAVRQGLFNG